MKSTIDGKYVLPMIILTWFTLESSPAHSDVLGTYKGGFASGHRTVAAELRCDPKGMCEIESIETLDGAQQPSDVLTRWPLRPLGGCSSPPQNEWGNCNVFDWNAVRKALKFAREHRGEQPIQEVREMLEPLLDSSAEVERCYSVQKDWVICELSQSPWNKPALLLFSPMYQPCYPPSGFCTYKLMPLFKTSDVAALNAKRDGFMPAPWKGPPSSQVQVESYVRDLQDKIRLAMIVPAGAPSTAGVRYQIQFSQETGRVYSVNFIDGCFCPSLRSAVSAAVQKIQPLPLLPIDQQRILGDRKGGAIYLETTVGSIQ